MASTSRPRRIVITWLTWGLAPVVLLAAIEVLLRLSGFPPPGAGATMRPDLDLLWISNRGDPRELRFQDRPADTLLAVSIGDSPVYGQGVGDRENFTALLHSATQGKLNALNLAGLGYSSLQSLIVLQTVLPRERPDLVVIATLWSDNNFDSFVDKELLARHQSFPFRLKFLATRLLSQLALRRWLLDQTGNLDSTRLGGGRHHAPEDSRPRRVAINDYAHNLWQIVDLAETVGADVLFVVLPNQEDIFQAMRYPAYEPYRSVLRDVAKRRGYPVVELPSLFRQSELPCKALFLDRMHPTVAGHRLIADAIINTLKEGEWFAGKSLRKHVSQSSLPTYTDPFVELD